MRAKKEEMSDYDKIRERNIAERKARFAKEFAAIDTIKSELSGQSKPAKKIPAKKVIASKKEKDPDWKIEEKDEKRGNADGKLDVATVRRSTRERKEVDYEEIEFEADSMLFCDQCDEEYEHGCTTHVPVFLTFYEYSNLFDVVESQIPGAGRGLYSTTDEVLKVGTRIGPYSGSFVPAELYSKANETGYAWEVLDSLDKKKVIGYVDPGPNPPSINLLAMVNMPNKLSDLCMIAEQYLGQIYYRVCKPIIPFQEVFTDYGDDYAETLGIQLRKKKRAKGKKSKAKPAQKLKNKRSCVPVAKKIPAVPVETKNADKKDDEEEEKAEDEGRPHSCQICKKKFGWEGNLKRHVATVHLKQRPHSCDFCDMKFGQKQHLNDHVATVHLKEKSHSCDFCDMKFGRKQHLNYHVATVHLKEKSHSCDLCDMKFGRKFTLDQHVQAIHEGRTFDCDLCDMKFGHKYQLNDHVKVGHEGRTFDCEICDMSFSWKSNLNSHLKTAHKS